MHIEHRECPVCGTWIDLIFHGAPNIGVGSLSPPRFARLFTESVTCSGCQCKIRVTVDYDAGCDAPSDIRITGANTPLS